MASSMTRKGKSLTGEDAALWAHVTAEIKPMKGKSAPSPQASTPMKAAVAARARTVPAPPPAKAQAAPSREMDKRTRERFEGGKMPIDAVLDLHGMDRGQAREQVNSFLAGAWQQAMRCVLIVTGKGRSGEGVLKTRLPEWVDEPPLRSIVLDIHPARQKHGGHGAYYVLLRRQRP